MKVIVWIKITIRSHWLSTGNCLDSLIIHFRFSGGDAPSSQTWKFQESSDKLTRARKIIYIIFNLLVIIDAYKQLRERFVTEVTNFSFSNSFSFLFGSHSAAQQTDHPWPEWRAGQLAARPAQRRRSADPALHGELRRAEGSAGLVSRIAAAHLDRRTDQLRSGRAAQPKRQQRRQRGSA